MTNLTDKEMMALIHVKLETTRAVSNCITDSQLASLSDVEAFEFADLIELVAILMLEEAGEFPDAWTSESLMDIYHYKLPTLLSIDERKNIKRILMTYVDFVGSALELPNYVQIKKDLAS